MAKNFGAVLLVHDLSEDALDLSVSIRSLVRYYTYFLTKKTKKTFSGAPRPPLATANKVLCLYTVRTPNTEMSSASLASGPPNNFLPGYP